MVFRRNFGKSQWRDKLIPILEKRNIDYFNPLIKGIVGLNLMKKMNTLKRMRNVMFIVMSLHLKLKEFFQLLKFLIIVGKLKQKLMLLNLFILGIFERKMYRSLEATMRLCKNIAGSKVHILKLNNIKETRNIQLMNDIYIFFFY